MADTCDKFPLPGSIIYAHYKPLAPARVLSVHEMDGVSGLGNHYKEKPLDDTYLADVARRPRHGSSLGDGWYYIMLGLAFKVLTVKGEVQVWRGNAISGHLDTLAKNNQAKATRQKNLVKKMRELEVPS